MRMTTIALVVASTALLSVPAKAAADDPVRVALDAVADVRAAHYETHADTQGDLAGPDELAAIEPRLAPAPRNDLPAAMFFDKDLTARCLRQAQACALLPRKPRVRAGVISLGISGIRVEDIAGSSAFPIVGVEEGAHAQGVVRPGDVIVGANGRLFPSNDDPRVHMGYALAEAQLATHDGILMLQLVRDGRPANVPIQLGVSGAYGEGWPYNSTKSRAVLDQAVDFLVERAPDVVNGFGFKTQTYGNILMLMSVENDETLDLARRMLSHTLPPHKVAKLHGWDCASWMRAYELIAQAEYYLLTGDAAVLPGIENRAQVIADGQAPSGTWGHGLPCRGYGELNQAGAACFLGLALADECGVSFNREALVKAIRFFAKYAGGTVPYGDDTIEFRGSNNGCASVVAVTFDILGEPELAERFARYVAYTYRYRELGHAENIFSHSWGPIAAARAPEEEVRMFMDNTLWLFELERTPWGGLWQLGKRACGSLTATTGPIGLFLGLPEARLRVLGAPRSVFGSPPPTDAAREAAQYYRDKNWAAFKTAAEACLRDKADAAGRDYARKLLAAYEGMEKHAAAVTALASENIELRKLHKAWQQLECLEMMLGGERPEMAALKKSLATDEARKILDGEPPPAPVGATREEEALPPREEIAKSGALEPVPEPGTALPPAPFSEDPADVVFRALRARPGAEIARYFTYPYYKGFQGVARALASHGVEALPLLAKMVRSEHPALRRGAVMSIGYLCDEAGKQSLLEDNPKSGEAVDVDRAIALIEDLAADPDAFVQLAVASTLKMCGETSATRRIVIELAGSRHPAAQSAALNFARYDIGAPETKVRVSMRVDSSFAEKNTVRQWEQSHFVLEQAREQAEPALPVLADYFADWAYRQKGMFADSATIRAMHVIETHIDKDTVLATVPGLCRTYMRLNNSDYKGWVKCREMVFGALQKLAPRARPQIREAIEEEKKFLHSATAEEWAALAVYGTTAEIIAKRIENLEALIE